MKSVNLWQPTMAEIENPDLPPYDFLVNAFENMDSDLLNYSDDQINSPTTLPPMAVSELPEWPSCPATSFGYLTPPESIITLTVSSPGYVFDPATFESSNSEESITLAVPLEDVLGEQDPPKRKRERKPKSETGEYAPPRAKKARKTKLYEKGPFEDKEEERKRLNAVNSQRHRDIKKKQKENVEKHLENVTIENDNLKKEVESLREKNVSLSQQVEVFKAHVRKQALSAVTLLQSGQISL